MRIDEEAGIILNGKPADMGSLCYENFEIEWVLLPMKAVNVIFPMDRQTTDLMPDRKKLQQKKAQTMQLKFMSQKLLWLNL